MTMIWTIIEVLINFYQAFLLFYFVNKRFEQKPPRKVWIDVITISSIGAGLTLFQYIDTSIPDTILFIIPFIYAIYTKEEKWYNCLFWIVVLATIFLGTIILIGNVFSTYSSTSWERLMEQNQARFVFVISTNIALTVAISIISNIGNKNYIVSKEVTTIFLILLLLEFVANEILYIIQINFHDEQPLYTYASLCILASSILTIALYEMMNIATYQQHQIDLKLQTVQMAQMHQEELRSMYSNMLAIQHDLRHRIVAAEQLLSRQSGSEKARVMNLLSNTSILNEFITGNTTFDAILTAKSAMMKQTGIQFTFVPYPLHELPLSEEDFSVLISNLLDNAIEGVMRIPTSASSRKIKLTLSKAQSMFSIFCENDANPETIHRFGNHFVSSKDHAEIHGFGTQSIVSIVKSVGGWVEFNVVKKRFTVSIMLPIEDKE